MKLIIILSSAHDENRWPQIWNTPLSVLIQLSWVIQLSFISKQSEPPSLPKIVTLLAEVSIFLASLPACTKSSAPLVFWEVNKPTTWNARDANDFVHAERFARKKPLIAAYKIVRPAPTAGDKLWPVRKRKESLKQSGLNGIWIRDLCDTGAQPFLEADQR